MPAGALAAIASNTSRPTPVASMITSGFAASVTVATSLWW